MDINTLYSIFEQCNGITTDSRRVATGNLFVALRGANFNGNLYAVKALEAGAAYAIVDEQQQSDLPAEILQRIVVVEDSLLALQALATEHRQRLQIPILGIVGSNGKTTTKELVSRVLAERYRVYATHGNLNNHIGVPLTLLAMDSSVEFGVVEMGASHPGDIKELVDIALPNYGLVTNVGKAHLLGFGSFEGVMKTKGELYDYLRRTSDKVFLNVDNPYLCHMAAERNLQSDPERPYSLVLPYGLDYSGAEVLPSSPESPFLRIRMNGVVINTNLVGSYNADNVMAAIAVGAYFGVSFEDAVKAIEEYVPSNNRSQMVKTLANTLIVDAYNANPTSMEAALSNFAGVQADKKIVLLGDMLELGEDSVEEHLKVIRRLSSSSYFLVCLVGKEFGSALEKEDEAGVKWFATSSELAEWFKDNPVDEAVILIKGSRGTRMEKVLEVL